MATLIAISQNKEIARIFTFGISSTADHHTLRSISRLGGGAFEYFNIKAKSTWEKKLRCQISRCCQPAVSNINLEWGDGDLSDEDMQAPAQITTVFSGSRLVVYALVNSCSQVVLKAHVPALPCGSKEVITRFATEDIKKSQGMIIHCLAARAIVQDWQEGALHSDRLHHEAKKMELQSSIVPLSIEYNIITPFTSFIAVEERHQGEDLTANTGPTVAELVEEEDVDTLPSLDWHDAIVPPIETNPEKHVANLLHTADTATGSLSFDAAQRYYEDAQKVAQENLKPQSSLVLEVADKLSKFYFHVRRSAKKAFSVIDNVYKKQQDIMKPVPTEQDIELQELEHLDQLEKAAEWAQLCDSFQGLEPVDIGPPIMDDEPSTLYDELPDEETEDVYLTMLTALEYEFEDEGDRSSLGSDMASGPARAERRQEDIDEIQDLMRDSIDRIIERGGSLDFLEERSDHLGESVMTYTATTKAVRYSHSARSRRLCILCCACCMCMIILVVIIVVLAVLQPWK